jgi:hypothetical protein
MLNGGNMTRLMAIMQYQDSDIFTIYDNSISIDFDKLDRGNVNDILGFGLYSNEGKLSCYDYENKLYNIYRDTEKIKNIKVIIYLSNENNKRRLATFFVDKIYYDDVKKYAEIYLFDGLTNWQNKYIFLNIGNTSEDINMPLLDVFYIVKKKLYDDHKIMIYASSKAEKLLESIIVKIPYIKEEVCVWSIINEICSASMCRAFCDDFGDCCVDTLYEKDKIAVRPYDIKEIDINSLKIETIIDSAKLYAKKIERFENITVGRNKFAYVLYNPNESYDQLSERFQYANINKNEDFNVKLFESPIEVLNFSKGEITTIRPLVAENGMTVTRITSKSFKALKKTWQNDIQTSQEIEEISIDKLTLKTKNDGVYISMNFIPKLATETYDRFLMQFEGEGVKETDEEIFSYGDFSSDSQKTIQKSRWIQADNIVNLDEGSKKHAEWIVENIKKYYSKGIDCLCLKCNISNYYGYNSKELKIDNGINSYPSAIQRGQVVVPYIIKNGVEQPYSILDDGTPKSYIVIGSKYSYSGSVTQTIYLQDNVFETNKDIDVDTDNNWYVVYPYKEDNEIDSEIFNEIMEETLGDATIIKLYSGIPSGIRLKLMTYAYSNEESRFGINIGNAKIRDIVGTTEYSFTSNGEDIVVFVDDDGLGVSSFDLYAYGWKNQV